MSDTNPYDNPKSILGNPVDFILKELEEEEGCPMIFFSISLSPNDHDKLACIVYHALKEIEGIETSGSWDEFSLLDGRASIHIGIHPCYLHRGREEKLARLKGHIQNLIDAAKMGQG